MAEEKARAAVQRFGLPREVSPSDALLEEVKWTAGHVEYLRGKVNELSDVEMTLHVTRIEEGTNDLNRKRTLEARANVWYDLYLAERKHLVAVSEAAIRAGIEQRRVEIAEREGLLVATVIRRILDGMVVSLLERGVDVRDHWTELTQTIVPRELRSLDGTQV